MYKIQEGRKNARNPRKKIRLAVIRVLDEEREDEYQKLTSDVRVFQRNWGFEANQPPRELGKPYQLLPRSRNPRWQIGKTKPRIRQAHGDRWRLESESPIAEQNIRARRRRGRGAERSVGNRTSGKIRVPGAEGRAGNRTGGGVRVRVRVSTWDRMMAGTRRRKRGRQEWKSLKGLYFSFVLKKRRRRNREPERDLEQFPLQSNPRNMGLIISIPREGPGRGCRSVGEAQKKTGGWADLDRVDSLERSEPRPEHRTPYIKLFLIVRMVVQLLKT